MSTLDWILIIAMLLIIINTGAALDEAFIYGRSIGHDEGYRHGREDERKEWESSETVEKAGEAPPGSSHETSTGSSPETPATVPENKNSTIF